jgi:hypothetical protein
LGKEPISLRSNTKNGTATKKQGGDGSSGRNSVLFKQQKNQCPARGDVFTFEVGPEFSVDIMPPDLTGQDTSHLNTAHFVFVVSVKLQLSLKNTSATTVCLF